MDNGAFEWDDRKAAANSAKHGVSFELARAVFNDPFALEFADNRQNCGEERFIVIGMVRSRLLFVVYTMKGDTIRIISARGAEPYESRRYQDINT